MIDDIRRLETHARRLELDAGQRARLLDQVAAYSQRFLDGMTDEPAFGLADGRAIYESPPAEEGIDLVDKAKQKLDGYAKRFKFIMGHDSGKIEIIGRMDDKIILKQIHSRPETPELASQMMIKGLPDDAGWFEDLV